MEVGTALVLQQLGPSLEPRGLGQWQACGLLGLGKTVGLVLTAWPRFELSTLTGLLALRTRLVCLGGPHPLHGGQGKMK